MLAGVNVGHAWYGRPADSAALRSTQKARTPASNHDLTSAAERILQDELAPRAAFSHGRPAGHHL